MDSGELGDVGGICMYHPLSLCSLSVRLPIFRQQAGLLLFALCVCFIIEIRFQAVIACHALLYGKLPFRCTTVVLFPTGTSVSPMIVSGISRVYRFRNGFKGEQYECRDCSLRDGSNS